MIFYCFALLREISSKHPTCPPSTWGFGAMLSGMIDANSVGIFHPSKQIPYPNRRRLQRGSCYDFPL